MAYSITLTESGLPQHDLHAAQLTAREILERRLGGSHGVEAAYTAAHAVIGPDSRMPAPDGLGPAEAAAVDRWHRAVEAVWDRLHEGFADLGQDDLAERTAEAALWIHIEGAELAPF